MIISTSTKEHFKTRLTDGLPKKNLYLNNSQNKSSAGH